ncbi:MAG: 30S ribosomal protein S3 [Anaerolineae bacterium]|nr:30S ribosomal protein S3 [Anaerolineae bacterium]
MGRKVHPIGFRLGLVEQHRSRWFAEGNEYKSLVGEDRQIRELVLKELPEAGISKVEIERFPPNQVRVTVHSAKPGVIIGRKGATVNELRNRLQQITNKKVKLDIAEIEHPEMDAFLVAESIAEQIERRISHKRAMKQAVQRALKSGAKGCMIRCGGRLAGAEMARVETVREGQVPRHTLRAEIDYARSEALTTYGRIGIKVWIYKGEHLPGAK